MAEMAANINNICVNLVSQYHFLPMMTNDLYQVSLPASRIAAYVRLRHGQQSAVSCQGLVFSS